MYYWCRLIFDDYGNIRQRKALEYCETEEELISMLNSLVITHFFEDTEQSLISLEKKQNLTGKDCESYNISRNSDYPQYQLYLKEYQLVESIHGKLFVRDVRNWHNQILACNVPYKRKNRRPFHRYPKQGRTHEKSGNYHWHSNIRQNLRLIDDGMLRRKYAGKFYGSVTYDPKVAECENNWKQAKVRRQWEWHKKKHQDRYCGFYRQF